MKNKIKIEEKTKNEIIEEIKKAKKAKKNSAVISGIKNINAIKKIAEALKIEINYSYKTEYENGMIQILNPIGDWNGYGYDKYPQEAEFPLSFLSFLKKTEVKKEKKVIFYTEDEKIEKWAKRLAKLTGMSLENAKDIAGEKIEYAMERLEDTVDIEITSNRIPTWYRKSEKRLDRARIDSSILLDRIKDEGHALAILSASNRHNNSNYDSLLEEGKEKKKYGEVEDVREYARMNYTFA